MICDLLKKLLLPLLSFSAALFLYCPLTSGEDTAPEEWVVIDSAYFKICSRPDANLNKIYGRLSDRWFEIKSSKKKNEASSIREKLASRLDVLFNRVEEVLDIYPRGIKLNIRIFKTREDLADEYERIFSKREEHKSFYIHKYRTIYTSEEDISDSVMAHEMGHAIVDNYFLIIPPEKIREMLASYVDLHLED